MLERNGHIRPGLVAFLSEVKYLPVVVLLCFEIELVDRRFLVRKNIAIFAKPFVFAGTQRRTRLPIPSGRQRIDFTYKLYCRKLTEDFDSRCRKAWGRRHSAPLDAVDKTPIYKNAPGPNHHSFGSFTSIRFNL